MLNENDFKFFNIFTLFWLIIGWIAFALTLVSAFYWWILVGCIAIALSWGVRFFLKTIPGVSKIFLIINIVVIAIITIFSSYTSPTIFSGRDQGSISQAAIRLSQENQLKFSTEVSKDFFEINSIPRKKMAECVEDKNLNLDNATSFRGKIDLFYCKAASSGKALNFPGFYYTYDGSLYTQFPIAYTSFLSFFYSFLGTFGFVVANAILFYIFLMSIFLLSYKLSATNKKYSGKQLYTALSVLFLVTTSFVFSWFLKFTLTENMALALLWAGILQLFVLSKSKLKNLKGKKLQFILLIMSLGLLIFTRIEGIAFFIAATLVLLLNKNTAQYFRKNFYKIMLPILILISIFIAWNFAVDIYFYKAITKAFFKDINENPLVSNPDYALSTIGLLKVFAIYGIIAPLILGLFSIGYFFAKKDYLKLIPFFVVLPSFIYLISPQITPDHPWMLRRFTFSIIPALIVYSVIVLPSLITNTKSKLAYFYIIFLITAFGLNIPAFHQYLTHSPGKNLLEETKKISEKFGENDLVLIDQEASGDKYKILSQPMNSLLGKNSVYFFNPGDIRELDLKKYDKIYLMSPENKVEYYKEAFWGDRLEFVNNYSINTQIIENSTSLEMPQIKDLQMTGNIFEVKK